MRAFFDSLFRDLGDPAVLLGQDGCVATANPAFVRVVDRAWQGVPFLDLVSADARTRIRQELVKAAAGDAVTIEVPHPASGGGATVVDYRFFPVEDGLTAGIGRVRDALAGHGDVLGRTQAELRHKERMLDEIQMELTQVPFIDPVTGVWNRLQVIERLTGEWSRSERWGSPLACLLIEAEALEAVRQHDGEAFADEVLKAIARRIKGVCRDHDIVGRYGGDRFVVIAVHCGGQGARHLAERLRASIAQDPVQVAGRTVRASARIGCCTNRSDGVEIMEDLFTVAGEALAEAQARAEGVFCAADLGG